MFDLTHLKEFNPALVYGFDPEASSAAAFGMPTLKGTIMHASGQYEDMLNAYLHAEQVILPIFRLETERMDNMLFLASINALHALISRKLLEENAECIGEYSNIGVLRWHNGMILNGEFVAYLSGLHECDTPDTLADHLSKEPFNVNPSTTLNFVALCERINRHPDINIDPSLEATVLATNLESRAGVAVLAKLQTAYHSDLLTAVERMIVTSVVTPSTLPSQIPLAMERYATTTLAGLYELDKLNLDAVAEFLANSFYELTEIHPFANANGRVATCVMNIFLRYLDLPSILLRHRGEADDESSLYSQAIKEIIFSRAKLQQLSKERIISAQLGELSAPKIRENIIHKQHVELQVRTAEVLQRLEQKHPGYNIESLLDEGKMPGLMGQKMKDTYRIESARLNELIRVAELREKALDAARLTHKSLASAAGFYKLKPDQKRSVIGSLNTLFSDYPLWKCSADKGTAWLTDLDESSASSIVHRLETMNPDALITSGKQVGTDRYMVKYECINVEILTQCAAVLVSHHTTTAASTDDAAASLGV